MPDRLEARGDCHSRHQESPDSLTHDPSHLVSPPLPACGGPRFNSEHPGPSPRVTGPHVQQTRRGEKRKRESGAASPIEISQLLSASVGLTVQAPPTMIPPAPPTALTTIHSVGDSDPLCDERSKELRKLTGDQPGFEVLAILTPHYQPPLDMFRACQQYTSDANGGDSNTQILYCPMSGNLTDILTVGPERARGHFGEGFYFFEDALTAHCYSTAKGDCAVHAIMRCNVVLGRKSDYRDDCVDRQLKRAPEGFHSVRGRFNRRVEWVVYNPAQAHAMEIILYRFHNPPQAMHAGPTTDLPGLEVSPNPPSPRPYAVTLDPGDTQASLSFPPTLPAAPLLPPQSQSTSPNHGPHVPPSPEAHVPPSPEAAGSDSDSV